MSLKAFASHLNIDNFLKKNLVLYENWIIYIYAEEKSINFGGTLFLIGITMYRVAVYMAIF